MEVLESNILKIASAETTPEIDFNYDGVLKIKGVSIPKDALVLYSPLLNWIDKYILTNPSNTVLELSIEYMNTASMRYVFDIIRRLATLKDKGLDLKIVWKYQRIDEGLLELGEYLENASNQKFEFEMI